MNIDRSDDEWRAAQHEKRLATDEVRAALRKHGRRMEWRRVAPFIIGLSMGAYSWFFEIDHQTNLFVGLAWTVFMMTNFLELRLKTMQVRLAQMDDKLDKLSRPADPSDMRDDSLLSELCDW
jgi:hypothetical protein